MAVNEVILTFAHCCQMSDNPRGKPTNTQSEVLGYGSGGNRCTESCNAMIGWEWDLGAVRSQWKSAEDVMFALTEQRNNGSDVSRPRNGSEVLDWVNKYGPAKGVRMGDVEAPSGSTMTSFESIVAMVNRGHVGMAGFGDYNKLRKYSTGKSPYSWSDPNGDGHVLMVVGYNIAHKSVWVNDSLLGDKYQPAEYTYASFVNAKYDYLGEVFAPPLPGAPAGGSNTVGVPTGWKDDGTILTAPNGQPVKLGFRKFILSQAWDENNVPMEAEHPAAPGDVDGATSVQIFKFSKLCWTQAKNEYFGSVGQDLMNALAGEGKDASQLAVDAKQMADMNDKINQLTAALQNKTPADVKASLNSILSSSQSVVAALETLVKEVA